MVSTGLKGILNKSERREIFAARDARAYCFSLLQSILKALNYSTKYLCCWQKIEEFPSLGEKIVVRTNGWKLRPGKLKFKK